MADAHANFAYGTVLVAPSPAASGVTLTLSSGAGALMPAVPFNATVWPTGVNPLNSNAEIVRVTAMVGDAITAMSRAQEGTSARTILVGDQFAATITAKTLTDAELVVSDGAASVQTGTLRLSNANGVSFGFNGQTLTASHNALTTAALSDHSHGNPTLNLTNLSGTTASNSAGLTLSLSAHPAQTVQPGIQSISAGTTRATTGEVVYSNSHGVSFGLNGQTLTASHNGLTTARASNDAVGLNTALTAGPLAWTVNSAGISLNAGSAAGTSSGFAGNLISGSLTHNTAGLNVSLNHPAWLTTARASNDAIGLNTAQSNVTWTVNSAGLSLDARGYAGTGTSATNASVTLNSNGLQISVAAPGGGGNFSAGVSNVGNTGGDTGISGTRLVLVGSQNITLNQATDANGLTVSFSGGAGAAGNTGFISAGAATASLGTVVFSNSNGVSFGVNGQTVTASHNGLTVQSNQSAIRGLGVSNTGQTAGNTGISTGVDWVLAGSQSITLSQSTAGGGPNTIWLQHPAWLTTAMQSNAVTLSNIRVSGGTTSNLLSALTFADSNGISWGLNGSVLTATVRTDYLSNIRISAGTTSNLLSAVTFADGNGISFGLNASTVTASHNGLTSQSNQNVTAANGGFAFQTLSFSNLNGISFGTSAGSAITASHNALTTARASNDAIGLNTAQTNVTWTVNSSGLSLNAAGYAGTGTSATNASITLNSNGLAISVAAPGGGAAVSVSDAATSGTVGRLAFTNLNGVTLSLSTGAGGSHTIVGSHNALTTAMQSNAVTLSNIRVSAGTTSNLLSALTFADGNGVSFGINASTVTASHNGLTSQSNQNVTAGNGGFAFQTLSFSNLNGISFGTSAGSAITASHNALTTARASNDGIGTNTAQTNVTWTVNSNGLSLNAAGYAGTGTTFAGANISASFTFNSVGLNMSASVAAPGAAAEANAINLLGANTAGNTTATGSTIGWSGLNLTLSGTNASQVVISAPATSSLSATGAFSISVNGSTISMGAGPMSAYAVSNTTQSTSGAVDMRSLSFRGAGGVSVGVSNGSVVISGAAGGAAATMSGWNPYPDIEKFAGQIGAGTLQFDPMRAPNVVFDRVLLPIICTNSSNSSGSHTLSFWVGLYSRNVATLSLVHSASGSTALTHSGTAGSYSLFSGNRLFTIGMTTTLTEGDYWIGVISRTTSGGTNGSYSNLIASNIASNFLGHFGSSHNTTQQYTLGQGVYTASTTGIPGSVGFSQIRGSDSLARRAVAIMFANGTV